MTSSSSSFGGKNYWLYGTAKSAMIGMVNNLRHEGRGLGINVNALMPGAATAMSMSNPTMKESIDKIFNANSPDLLYLLHCFYVVMNAKTMGSASLLKWVSSDEQL